LLDSHSISNHCSSFGTLQCGVYNACELVGDLCRKSSLLGKGNEDNGGKKKNYTALIIVVIVVVVVFIAALIILIFFVYYRRKKAKENTRCLSILKDIYYLDFFLYVFSLY
jgi:hypothetical protein